MLSTVPRTALVAALLLALGTTSARAQDAAVVLSSAPAPVAESAPRTLPIWGVMLGAGVPDGATGTAVFRPYSWLRAEAGGAYNMISKGVLAGVSVLPFGAGPSATLEGGHYFDGNANGIARTFAGAGFHDSALLQRVGYDFVNAHLGLDFGTRRVVFFIHGGMSYVGARVHNATEAVGSTSGSTTVSFNQDPSIRIFTPSAKLGLIFYIW